MPNQWNMLDIEKLLMVRSAEELRLTVRQLTEQAGCSRIAYHLLMSPGIDGITGTHITSYPNEWVEAYLADGLHKDDPVVKRGQLSVAPFLWEDLGPLSSDSGRVMNAAKDFHIEAGFTVPVRGSHDFGLFSVVPDNAGTADASSYLRHMAPAFTIFGMTVHEVARQVMRSVPLSGDQVVRLSRRETQVMQWIAAGKTAWEISMIMNLSEYTIRSYIRTALTKLSCTGIAQGAVKAVVLGLVELPG